MPDHQALADHPRYAALLAAIMGMRIEGVLRPWTGHGYRCARQKYALGDDFMSGAGSVRHGGRFTTPGGVATIYVATTALLAVAETLENYARRHRQPWQVSPLSIIAVEARLDHVLDLTSNAVRVRLAVTLESLEGDNWMAANDDGRESLCQPIGRAAHAAGVQALLVSSRLAPDGANLVLFPDRIDEECRRLRLRDE